MDSKPSLEHKCSICSIYDLLPSKCQFCLQWYCSNHLSLLSHNCQSQNKISNKIDYSLYLTEREMRLVEKNVKQWISSGLDMKTVKTKRKGLIHHLIYYGC